MTNFTDLRIRSGPGLTDAVLGYMTAHKAYVIVEQQGTWGRISDVSPKWVHLGYCVKLA